MVQAPPSFSTLIDQASGEEVIFACDLTVGRDPRNDLVLPSRRISAQHARIEWRAGTWYLRDLGSTNGTLVNGQWLRGLRALAEGNVLQFGGESVFSVQTLAPPLETSAPLPAGTEEGLDGRRWEIVGLELCPIPPEAGAIRIETASGIREVHADLPFHLLRLLAAHPGEWMKDDDLRAALWGRRWDEMHRNTLLELVRVLRRMLTRKVIEKERGRTRLDLPPEVVRVLPA